MIYLVLKLNFLVSVFLYNKKNPQVTFLWLKNFRPSPLLLLLPLFSTFVDNINAYLIEAPDIFIENRKKTISSVSNVVFGSMPNDGGILSDYSFENKEEIVKKYPLARSMFKPFIGAKEHLYKASITKRNHGRKCNHCNCSWLAGINQRVRGRYACPKCKKTNLKNVNNLD